MLLILSYKDRVKRYAQINTNIQILYHNFELKFLVLELESRFAIMLRVVTLLVSEKFKVPNQDQETQYQTYLLHMMFHQVPEKL